MWNKDVRFFAVKSGGQPKAHFYFGAFQLIHRFYLIYISLSIYLFIYLSNYLLRCVGTGSM